MEKIEKGRRNPKIERLLYTAMLAIASSLTTTLIALPQKSFSQTTNNKNNPSLSIKKISVSDYQKMLEQRDKNIQNQLDRRESKESLTEYLERTQKEMFLSSYKSNKNMVKYNIDKIGGILKDRFGYRGLKNPIEVLNTAIIELAKSDKINGLNNYSDKINVEDFDINTINSIGFIETWEEGGKDVTYNPSANGVLGIIIKNLETTKTIEHYNQEVKKQEPIKKSGQESVKKNEQESVKKDIEIIEKNKQEKVIETIKEKPDGESMEERVKKVDGGYPVIIPNKRKETSNESNKSIEIVPEKSVEAVEEKQVETSKTVTQKIKEEEQVEKAEKVEQQNIGKGQDMEERVKKVDGGYPVIIPNKNKETSDETDISVEEVENIVNTTNIESSTLKESMDMFVDYDFQKNLAQGLPIQTQKTNIQQLMDENKTVKKFVEELEGFGIYFRKGDDTEVNRTSAILRVVNGDFEFGFKALNSIKESNLKGGNAVAAIIIQSVTNNDNLKIIESMSRDKELLEKKLDKNKLNGISYQEIINVVNGFRDKGLKKAFIYHLLNNDIVSAQRIMGMELDCDSRYPDYKAGNKLGRSELHKIQKLGEVRRYAEQDEIMANPGIPQDVKDAYMKFVNGEFNNKGRQFSILSKTDLNLYLFSSNYRLLARENSIIGKKIGDQKNNPMAGITTTPGGLYEVGRAFDKTASGQSFFAKYGTHYIVLIPLNGQYTMSDQYTMGIHGTYEKDPSRDKKIKSNNAKDRRESNGCINMEDEIFGEIYNHLKIGTILYVTKEPSQKDIDNYLRQ